MMKVRAARIVAAPAIALVALLALTGCGQRGPLVLPRPPAAPQAPATTQAPASSEPAALQPARGGLRPANTLSVPGSPER